ncbi:MAG: 4-alpha-glucanotransferase [Anaeromusa sp.]|uniref:4-alpha-glucanotransferase n=1 Tax=Anaeromusa sp. TaxID=1872520 RepID=UPI002B1EB41E|nr:4-alpha-glucanotransferase [Anaeromusa sp.]MEA4836453.1 4-alpha-glucanotransferase [Anaeromusa sp.]
MTEDSLNRLAALAGIEEGWWDFFGAWRVVPPDTKHAFLAAMGIPADSETDRIAAIARLENAPWLRPLPPTWILSETDNAPTLAVTLPKRWEDAPMAWMLEEENGAVHRGSFLPDSLPCLEEPRTIAGETRQRYRLALPFRPPLGLHRFRLSLPDGCETETTLIAAPSRAFRPSTLDGNGKIWGFATQLYALRRKPGWGVGDFSDLERLGRRAAGLGASLIGINPLHALFPARPERFSPYSASSRTQLNILYIDVEKVADFQESAAARRLFAAPGFQAVLTVADAAEKIDYPTVGRAKRAVLDLCWDHFRQHHQNAADSRRGLDFQNFVARGGRAAERLATFDALQEHVLATDPALGYWRDWPKNFQDPDGPVVAEFARSYRSRIDFFLYLQWLAETQLAAAQTACREAGMPVGLYRDLAVGIASDGSEAWANQAFLCLGVSVGAPPDPLNLAGQDWGLTPFNPHALLQTGCRPMYETLAANMAQAGALRLDHAMSLQRLYWIPDGIGADQGAYVRYPADDLFALVALASQRHQCLVIGEDLGTVPDGFRERMAARGLFGYRLMVFEREGDGRFKTPAALSQDALVGIGTHDLPSLGGWWRGLDIALREKLALYPRPEMAEEERIARTQAREALIAALAAEGVIDPAFAPEPNLSPDALSQLALALYRYLDRAPSRLLMVQFEDVLGMVSQMNLPGTSDEYPNWRTRLPMDVDALMTDPRILALARMLAGRSIGS